MNKQPNNVFSHPFFGEGTIISFVGVYNVNFMTSIDSHRRDIYGVNRSLPLVSSRDWWCNYNYIKKFHKGDSEIYVKL